MVQNENEPILATGGYDHTIKIWVPHLATAVKTLQHSDSQVYFTKSLQNLVFTKFLSSFYNTTLFRT